MTMVVTHNANRTPQGCRGTRRRDGDQNKWHGKTTSKAQSEMIEDGDVAVNGVTRRSTGMPSPKTKMTAASAMDPAEPTAMSGPAAPAIAASQLDRIRAGAAGTAAGSSSRQGRSNRRPRNCGDSKPPRIQNVHVHDGHEQDAAEATAGRHEVSRTAGGEGPHGGCRAIHGHSVGLGPGDTIQRNKASSWTATDCEP